MRDLEASITLDACLFARPEPHIDESPSSWVQRLSGSHQYSFKRLSQVTDIHPKNKDWDCGVTNEDWRKLLELADASSSSCGEARFAYTALLSRSHKETPLLNLEGRPSYRWCSACFIEDRVPYLRWHWRLSGCTRCHIHKCPLEERCPWCKSPLSVHRALLVSCGRAKGVFQLSNCGSCGMPLLNGEAPPPDEEDDVEHEPDSVAIFIGKFRDAYLRDDKQCEFDFGSTADVSSASAGRPRRAVGGDVVWINLIINRIPEKPVPAFQLDARSFLDTKADKPMPQGAGRWTDGLRRFDRWRLAQALRKVRSERTMHRQSGQSVEKSFGGLPVYMVDEDSAAHATWVDSSVLAASSIKGRDA